MMEKTSSGAEMWVFSYEWDEEKSKGGKVGGDDTKNHMGLRWRKICFIL